MALHLRVTMEEKTISENLRGRLMHYERKAA